MICIPRIIIPSDTYLPAASAVALGAPGAQVRLAAGTRRLSLTIPTRSADESKSVTNRPPPASTACADIGAGRAERGHGCRHTVRRRAMQGREGPLAAGHVASAGLHAPRAVSQTIS